MPTNQYMSNSSNNITYSTTASTPSQTAGTIDTMFRLLYKQQYFTEMLSLFFVDPNDRQEFKQYISEKLLLQDNNKVLEMYNNGQLRFWISRVFSNNVKSSSSDWNRIYRNPKMDLTDFASPDHLHPDTAKANYKESIRLSNTQDCSNSQSPEPDVYTEIELALSDIIIQRPRLAPYVRIFKMHFYDGLNFTKIHKQTKIDYKVVCKQIELIQILVKNHLKQKNITPYDND